MTKGLIVWKDKRNNSILLDADNVFWGIIDNDIIPRDILSLYEKVKARLDREFYDFRFSQNLSAIYIDPTDRCNLSCSYCYIPAKIRRSGRSMTKEEISFILEKVAKYFKKLKRKAVVVFHASEPLLVKESVFEAIEKFSKEFKFGLQTNATLLEEEDVEFLRRYSVGVGISLDSFSCGINNRLRPTVLQGGSFPQVVKAIEWFKGYEGLNVITTVTRLNVSQLPNLVKFLHQKRVPCLLLNPVRLTQPTSHWLKPKEELLTKYFIKAVDTAIELSRTTRQSIIIGNFTNVILGIIAPSARRLMCDISPCGGGRCFLTITASGKMIPCGEFIGLDGFSGGNIFKIGIRQAMQSRSFKRLRDRFAEKIGECKNCIFRNICGAPCPAELYSLGNMYQRSVFCEFYNQIIRYAFRLIAEGKEKYCFRKEGLKSFEYEYSLKEIG